jgi:N,N'-diacetylchitobiose transport system substrate-binding protein
MGPPHRGRQARHPREDGVNHRLLVAAGLAAALVGVAGCGGDSGTENTSATDATGKTLNVWLMNEAQSTWEPTVKAASAAVKAKYPGLEIKVAYQTWGDHLTKLDAALGGKDVPDVVEFGNTEVVKYAASGALTEVSKGDYENSDTWLKGLEESCTFEGKLWCVPYYAGSRAIVYNKDLFTGAAVAAVPKTYPEFSAAMDKLMAKYGTDKQFSAFFQPGQYWYAAMSYVYDQGGSIAKKDGDQWAGNLSAPESIEGLKQWKAAVDKWSRADKRGNEEKQAQVFAQGKVGTALMLGWEAAGVTDPKTGNPKLEGKLGFFPLPSVKNPGKPMPVFLGGSDLAIPAKSANQEYAKAWIKEFTNTRSETEIAKAENIPNTTKLLPLTEGNEKFAALAQGVSEGGWFVPNAPGWATVEQQKVMQNFLVAIATGADIAAEAKKADDTIAKALNQKV